MLDQCFFKLGFRVFVLQIEKLEDERILNLLLGLLLHPRAVLSFL